MSFPHRKRPSLITSAHIVLLVIGTAIFTLFAFNKNKIHADTFHIR